MRRVILVLPVIAVACAISIQCAATSLQSQAERSRRDALAAMSAAMLGAQAAAQAAQDVAVARLEADLRAIPDGPDRPARVEARKAQARAEAAAIQARRDKVLRLVEEALALEAAP
jgi:hypothetical protein